MTSSAIVQKLWNYCNVLRDDGMSYGDYVEQLTYLLFLKMADERTKPPYVPASGAHEQSSAVPAEYSWPSLVRKDGDELFDHYRHLLEQLGNEKGLLALIFNKAQNKFQDPTKLRRLIVDLIDKENWSMMSADVKGDAYEGLLEKNAQDVKTGAGQYFTPRPLIAGIVDVMAPKPGETLCDPASGTGGFILAAHDYVVNHYPNMTREEKRKLKENTFKGIELVQGVARLCAMNLLLHGIGSQEYEPIVVADSLAADPGERFHLVVTNPPFGKKSSITIVGEDGKAVKERETYERDDFWATTSNKQLNFLQHVKTLLRIGGRAAIVVPDNVLFEGGAGETVRRKLLHECEVHTLLRLPTGLFYAQGVKANVLFFEKKQASETP
jgi:type I restriction enzyme M protein